MVKAAFMYYQEHMVFKLIGPAEQEALALDGAHYFNPMGGDRPDERLGASAFPLC